MIKHSGRRSRAGLLLLGVAAAAPRAGAQQDTPTVSLAPASFARLGTVDERFQSYNVEMLEVTGGKFWKPYGAKSEAPAKTTPTPAPSGSSTPTGMNPDLYQYRPPIDLGNARLRKLAAGLGPAYVRVSGTWANSTYFPDSEKAPDAAPQGFGGVLTRSQWKGVVDFSRAVDAPIVTSVATSVGTRDAEGVWTPDQARRLFEYTKSLGGRIAATEFMNEPNFAAMGGAPAGYDAAAYGRDFKRFHAFIKEAAPGTVLLGPGSVGERATGGLGSVLIRMLKTRDLLAASGPGVDVFSYHHYGTVSQRCAGAGAAMMTSPEEALSEDWLSRTDATLAYYKSLRDEFEPGKALWLTEVADAACGGNPWASSFLDTFRYLDQLGRLARQGVQMVAHNTLVASDYGLLDEHDFTPKPSYWGALLWRRLMGATVLDSGVPIRAGLHAYAHCLRGTPGGVALLVINTDKASSQTLTLPTASQRYTLSSTNPHSRQVQLNGKELALGGQDDLPPLVGAPAAAGEIKLAPATITFLAVPGAGNSSCR